MCRRPAGVYQKRVVTNIASLLQSFARQLKRIRSSQVFQRSIWPVALAMTFNCSRAAAGKRPWIAASGLRC